MAQASFTIDDCAGCCVQCECPEEDLDIAITMDPCSLTCFQATDPSRYGTFSGIDFSGGHTLTYIPPALPGDPAVYEITFPDGGDVTTYVDSDCEGESSTNSRLLVIQLFCNPDPIEDGKCLGLILSVDAIGAATYTILDVQTDSADWFGYDEGAVFSTPCGDITVTVPSP